MNVLILSGYGINCEDETIHAFRKLDFKGKIVHINDLIKSPKQLQTIKFLQFLEASHLEMIQDQEMRWLKKLEITYLIIFIIF